MKIKQYPKHNGPDRGFSQQEIERGENWLYADVECPHCGKVQSIASTGYIGGPCVKCGKKTNGKND